ncbi:tyrosine-type recombinase/integrase [Halalkalibacter nanhaiisediminis]|uniref:Site-specific recombinase XerD n=1 Tax=Halalkalibacter nanhaiisediminis TaxID=688079 RepID=A0A562QET9_9BACI|nr:site-specific integrase [Halalkalibacter nanhaiisediminis]TWI55262.1 site-specific recombinase XerD [Halalkalibacter nanhaiisediminis]
MEPEFPAFIEDYLNQLLLKGRKDSTIRRYQYDLFDFSNWLRQARQTTEVIDWKTISTEELELFFEELSSGRNYHIRTIRRIHSVLKQVSRYQKSLGSSELRPIEDIEPPELTANPLSESEWLTEKERTVLLRSVMSDHGLSDQQMETFHFYKERNVFMVRLFLHYGLTLREVHQLSMTNIKFERNELVIDHESAPARNITLEEQDKKLAYTYYKQIPEPVRPRLHSADPFFVAFDFKRKTFHWSYDDDGPKRMTIIAMQKMLRMEVKRAQLRKGISAQTLRHTFILQKLINGMSQDELIDIIGYTSPLSIKRYLNTAQHMTKEQIARLNK